MQERTEIKYDDGLWINWRICSIEPMNKYDAMQYQANKGYYPAGYGLDSFKCEKHIDSKGKDYYISTWVCYSSCD